MRTWYDISASERMQIEQLFVENIISMDLVLKIVTEITENDDDFTWLRMYQEPIIKNIVDALNLSYKNNRSMAMDVINGLLNLGWRIIPPNSKRVLYLKDYSNDAD